MNDGQRLLGEDLSAHTALEQYRFPVVVVVVVFAARERTNTVAVGYWILVGTLEAHNSFT